MNLPKLPLLVVLFIAATVTSRAAHPFLCCDYNGGKVCAVSSDGKIEWEYPCRNPQDCWRLPNGNTLFCFTSGAVELTPDKKVAWEYKAPSDVEVEVHACQPLPDGKVLIVECGNLAALRQHPTLKEIAVSRNDNAGVLHRPVAEFWAEYDAQRAAGKQ